MQKRNRSRNKKHSPRNLRISEKLQKGRCDNCKEVNEVLFFCEKDVFYDRKLVEITLCEGCISKLIIEFEENKEDMRSKLFLPILKFMKGDIKENVSAKITDK